MKRVAIPINEGKLSEYFGGCSHYEIYDIKDGSIHKDLVELPDVFDILELPQWASKNGITDIITYKIDNRIIRLFNRYKINLYVGIDIDTPENLIDKYLGEQMTSNQKIISEIFNELI